MSSYCIRKTRIQTLKLPKGYDVSKINIGVPVMNDENLKVGLKNIGDAILPAASFGKTCEKMHMDILISIKLSPKKIDM